MDPQANLQEQRTLAARIKWQVDNGTTPSEADVDRLAELVIDLDNWIMNHGFLPADWQKAQQK